MALVTLLARRLQRTHSHLFVRCVLSSHIHYHTLTPPILAPFFTQSFHQTHPIPPHTIPHTPHFSTLQPSQHQNIYDPINFSQFVDETHEHNQPGVLEFVQLLKENDQNVHSDGEAAVAFLDNFDVKPRKDLVYSAIWAFREEWKLAFLVFKWGEKWGCNVEKTWCLMIWVLGNQKKFNTAWCLIRDLHLTSMDTQQAMFIMIDRYAAANDPGKAIETFQIMEKFKLSPDQKAFYTLLDVLCKHGNMEEAEEFMLLNKKLFPLETEGFNIIMNGWCNISVDIFEAKRIWREMSKCCIIPNATSYTHLISCFSKVGNLFDSLRLYDEMKKRGWIPGLEVYNSLVYVLTCENCLNEALKIVDKIRETGLQPDSVTYNSMIRPLCEALMFEEARTILANMIGENVDPTIETYHAFLGDGNLEVTLAVINHMKKAELGPRGDTFLMILGKFFKMREPENALKIWIEMKQYEVVPDASHYAALVEGLAMCGLLIKAREFYAEMRSNGIPDDPKLKKLLKEHVQGSSHQRGQGQQRIVRYIRKATPVHCGKSKVKRNEIHVNQSRRKTSRGT